VDDVQPVDVRRRFDVLALLLALLGVLLTLCAGIPVKI
jgi:hypothetical protein